MNYKELASQLLELAGGKANLNSVATCMTRLRLHLKDRSAANEKGMRELEGVLGLVELSDGLQVVLGPGTVNQVGEAFAELSGLHLGAEDLDASELAQINKSESKAKQQHPVQRFLQHIANIFVPLLPGIIAAGLINGLTNVINFSTKGALNAEWWYQCIRTMGWAMFAFMPIFVGMNACREFKGSAVLGGIAGAMSVAMPTMPLLTKINDAPLLMPITGAAFAPSTGGLLAALFMGIFFAFLERNIRKFMPKILDTFFTPFFTLIVGGLISLIVLQPLGLYATQGIFKLLDFVYNQLGIVGGYVLSASFLPLVSVGLHQALAPIHVLLNNPDGPTHGINFLLPILMMAGGGQVGAGLALYLKTKNKKLKRLTRDSLPIGILGIGEPMMYAVTLPLGRPFVTACLGAGIGGLLAALFKLGAITQGVSGLFGLLIVEPGSQIMYLIAMVGAYIGGFVLTWLFGVDEKRIAQIYGDEK